MKMASDLRFDCRHAAAGCNANFAWQSTCVLPPGPGGQHMLLLANGSMSSNTNNEGEIAKAD